jgi:hypothetical protein
MARTKIPGTRVPESSSAVLEAAANFNANEYEHILAKTHRIHLLKQSEGPGSLCGCLRSDRAVQVMVQLDHPALCPECKAERAKNKAAHPHAQMSAYQPVMVAL